MATRSDLSLSRSAHDRRLRLVATAVGMLLTAAVVALLILPGERYRDQQTDVLTTHDRWLHGWPLTYLQREVTNYHCGSAIESETPSTPWDLDIGMVQFRPAALAIDVTIGLMIVGASGGAFYLWRSRRNGVFRFNLVDLAAIVGVAAVACAFYAQNRNEHAHEQAVIARTATREPGAERSLSHSIRVGGPTWLREMLPEGTLDIFNRVEQISPTPEEMALAVQLRHVRVIELGEFFPPHDYTRLAEFPRLETLGIYFDPRPETELLPTVPYPKTLITLVIHGVVGKATGADLAGLDQLENLNIIGERLVMTPVLMERIASLSNLRRLDLVGRIPPRAIRKLAALRGLSYAGIDNAEEADLDFLRQQLPNCEFGPAERNFSTVLY